MSEGQGLIEYAILLALIAAFTTGAAVVAGEGTASVFNDMNVALGGEPISIDALPTTGEDDAAPTPTPTLDAPPTPGPTPTTAPADAFRDDFDDPCPAPPAPCPAGWWETRGGHWSMEDGQYCAGEPGGEWTGEHRSFAGQSSWTDYTIITRAVLHSHGSSHTSIGFGIYFRVSMDGDQPTGYVFQYDRGLKAFVYRKVVGGREQSPFARSRVPDEYQWYDVPREIRIDVQGNTYTTYIDGELVLQATDNSFPAGQIGLRTWTWSKACFDSIRVTMP